jgi:hypothetical protein
MKFLCECGHTIRDQTDYIPYKAWIAKDQDSDYVWGALRDDLGAYAAIVRGQDTAARAAWIRQHLPLLAPQIGTHEELQLTDEYVVGHYLALVERTYLVDAYECEQCGRLWVARGVSGGAELVGFKPDSGRYERVFATEHRGGDRPRQH